MKNVFQIRCYQKMMKMGVKFIKIKEPELVKGIGAIQGIPSLLETQGAKSVFIASSKTVFHSGILDEMLTKLTTKKIKFVVYLDVVPNASINCIEKGLDLYLKSECDSLIAIGGGSVIDATKMIGARAVNQDKNVEDMKGLLKVKKNIPFMICVPTTAGTGSECTIAAVVSNPITKDKYAITDPHILPKYAVLDPNMIVSLPPKITSTTGMDALTHAVEAYIGKSNTRKTKKWAKEAVKLIFDNLEKTYHEPTDLKARENMLHASYLAGLAFTRAYVGYVHAMAHALGGFYGVSHGYANAILLPYVLESYGTSCAKELAELCDLLSLAPHSSPDVVKAQIFIDKIKEMNKNMDIPTTFKNTIVTNDIPLMCDRAIEEAIPLYPTPRIFKKEDFDKIYRLVQDNDEVN